MDRRPRYGEPKSARNRRVFALDARLAAGLHDHHVGAVAAGVDTRIISGGLGHGSAAFTADVYQHLLPGLDGDAAERIAGVVLGGPAPTSP